MPDLAPLTWRSAALLLIAPLALAAASCGVRPMPPHPFNHKADARLRQLHTEFWEHTLRNAPRYATMLGERAWDAELERVDDASQRERLAVWRGLLSRARELERRAEQLSPSERITLDVLTFELDKRVRTATACQGWRWQIDQLGGPHLSLPDMARHHTITTPQDAWNLLARYGQVQRVVAEHIANLRAGREAGLIAPRPVLERVARQLDAMHHLPPESSPFTTLALEQIRKSKLDPDSLKDDQGRTWSARLTEVVATSAWPALVEDYRVFVETELVPNARSTLGVASLPGGDACYQARAFASTSLNQTADARHNDGLRAVDAIQKRMDALVQAQGYTKPTADYLALLGRSPDLRFDSSDAIVDANRDLIARATDALPQAFHALPDVPLEVQPIDPIRERDAPIAYYQSAPPDRARPAVYYVNTFAPTTRRRHTMAALAFHEAVPGHHLQRAVASTQATLPPFQRHAGLSAFSEGWALYAEQLAGELGLYTTPEETMGGLIYAMWRAVRMVVDTGIHAKGWTRQQALDYLVQRTGKDPAEAANEIDRYIAWPGQALAYHTGKATLLQLRHDARDALGPRFDLRDFHREVLRHGAVPLTTLQRAVRAWIAERASNTP